MKLIKPKILFISPCTPDIKGTAWQQRSFSFLNAYSNFMDVDLWYTPTFNEIFSETSKKLIATCNSVVAFKKETLNYSKDATFRMRVQQADFIHTFRTFIGFEHKAILWDFDELPRQLVKITSKNIEERINVPEIYIQMRKRSKVAYSSSFIEKDLSLGKVFEIPNVYDINIISQRNPDKNILLFVGNMDFQPNIDAICWFTTEVLPILPKSIKLRVVGRSPQSIETRNRLSKLAIHNNLEFIFDVADCNPYYETAIVALAPIFSGGGTKVKILEAFANHCPVISTSKGIEGLHVSHENEVIIANTKNEFKEAILKVNVISKLLSDNAYQYLVKHHSQQIVKERIQQMISQEII
jgi:glycosyltransferase involved in cell wall biosynthesis